MLKDATLVSIGDHMRPCPSIQTLIDKGSFLLKSHKHRTNPNILPSLIFLVGLEIIFI